MPKRASHVVLSEQEKEELERLTKRHRSEQQQVQRARMVLAAAQGHSNAQIARELQVNVDTVRLWRDRWVGLQGIDLKTLSVMERLQDAPRPGAPATRSRRNSGARWPPSRVKRRWRQGGPSASGQAERSRMN
jgi:hypothetical protein